MSKTNTNFKSEDARESKSPSAPLVSCLCMTRKRTKFLKLSITCFQHQTHKNKELIVLYADDDDETHEFLQGLPDEQIYPVRIKRLERRRTMGELRNIMLEKSNGEYLCHWDDDDWYNPVRIETQLRALGKHHKAACVISRNFIFDQQEQKGYLSLSRLWENSLLFHRKKVQELGIRYREVDKREDFDFLEDIIEKNLVFPLLEPTLYIYNINGYNVWKRRHYEKFFRQSQELSEYQSSVLARALDGSLNPLEASQIFSSETFLETLPYVLKSEEQRP
jgi:glycosyltransferase involved in cell wall biosynthesis